MASNLLQDVLRHTAHGHIDVDKDDSDDELVNVVRSICLVAVFRTPNKPSSHSQEHPNALVRLRAPHHLLAVAMHAFLVAIY